jgi:Pvc16 N-terminal domain
MANALAPHSVGNSLVSYLKKAYAAQKVIDQAFDFRLISSGELAGSAEPARNTLTLFLYRITQAAETRSPTTPAGHGAAPAPLALELHYLLTAWADDALMEQSVLTWAMREIQMHPVLDSSTLSADGGWAASDVVQIVAEELSLDEMARIWSSLSPKHRLSVGYVVRVVRVDSLR